MELYETIRKRVACREFLPKPVPPELLLKILRAGAMAPSPENFQPWEFVLVNDKEIRRELTQMKQESRRQVLKEWFPGISSREIEKRIQKNTTAMLSAPVFVAVCYKYTDSHAEIGDLRISLSHAASWICIGYVWLATTAEGLGLSPTFYSFPYYDRAKALIGLPAGYELSAVLRIGYPLKKPVGRKKTVLPLETKIHENRF